MSTVGWHLAIAWLDRGHSQQVAAVRRKVKLLLVQDVLEITEEMRRLNGGLKRQLTFI
jgi:hypothetical protein